MASVDLFAVQPYMIPSDYFDQDRFYRKIKEFFVQADRLRQNLSSPAAIAFPEDIATFLCLLGQSALLSWAQTIDQVFTDIGKRLWRPMLATMFARRYISVRRAFFHLTAPATWSVWHFTMADLARKHAVTVVAGSALLPANALGYNQDRFRAESAAVYNLSVTYRPDGQMLSYTQKVNLVPRHEDVLDLTGGDFQPALATSVVPGTRSLAMATAICYDAFMVRKTASEPDFFHNVLAGLDRAGAEIVVVPSANPWPWDQPWPIDRQRPQRLRRDQWADEALPAGLKLLHSVALVINPHLLGSLLDLRFDGLSTIWARDEGRVRLLASSAGSSLEPSSECIIHYRWEP